MLGAMDGRDEWWERVREIHAICATWWWCCLQMISRRSTSQANDFVRCTTCLAGLLGVNPWDPQIQRLQPMRLLLTTTMYNFPPQLIQYCLLFFIRPFCLLVPMYPSVYLVYSTAHCKRSKVGDLNRGWPEGSLFNSYYTDVGMRTTPFPG